MDVLAEHPRQAAEAYQGVAKLDADEDRQRTLEVKTLAELVPGAALTTKYIKFERPPQRAAGMKVKDVSELVEKLANVAKVI